MNPPVHGEWGTTFGLAVLGRSRSRRGARSVFGDLCWHTHYSLWHVFFCKYACVYIYIFVYMIHVHVYEYTHAHTRMRIPASM